MVLHSRVKLAICIVIAGTLVLSDSTKFVVRQTVYGKVRGYVLSVLNVSRVERFVGIPYAAPPTGQLRFENPQEPQPWAEALNATDVPPACPQKNWEYMHMHVPDFNRTDEDCLYLNVYVPQTSHDAAGGLAVLVHVHGGSNSMGTAAMFHGDVLAALGNIVVVTFNYRLGPFGFLSGEHADFPGNYGLLDQSFALQWVQQNIRFFDGNPSKVTLQGHSAGSSDVGLHIFSPKSKGLFRYVVMMSGSPSACFAIARPPRKPANVLTDYAEVLNCSFPDKNRIKQCLKNIDWETFLKENDASWKSAPRNRILQYIAVVDDVFISDRPENLIGRAELNGEVFMTGVTRDECSIWVTYYSDQRVTLNSETVKTVVVEGVLADNDPDLTDLVLKLYKPWSDPENITANAIGMYRIMSDSMFVAPAVAFASQLSEVNKTTYFYSFEFQSPVAPPPPWLGVPHGRDLFYLFGCPFTGHPLYNYTDDDRHVSRVVMEMWSNLVKHGKPSTSSLTAEQLPLFTEADQFYVKISGDTGNGFITTGIRPRAKHVIFWNSVLPWLHGLLNSRSDKMGTITVVFISLTGLLVIVLFAIILSTAIFKRMTK